MHTEHFFKSGILLTVCLTLFCSCGNSQQESIEKIADMFNVDGLMQLDKIEKTDSEFILSYTLSEKFSSFFSQELEATSRDVKNMIISSIRNELNADLLRETLDDVGLTWRMKIKNSVNDAEYDFDVLPSDFLSIDESSLQDLTPDQIKIVKNVDVINASCPSKVGEGLILSSVRFNDGNIVYTYEVDEEINGQVKDFCDNAKEMADGIIDFFSSDMSQIFVEQCAKADANVYFDYFGQSSGQTFRYVFDTKKQKVTYSII